ncbi:hypothetical protein CJ030_MR6G018865 [Morella rubra]|uniref:Uncharacterized protein n=1 Tax=Morella rubra TaxID=262757 RepID=A0A6A1VBH9_9ROSI|nr:hypothetical protein CJ030_MR6G018865 [Morella rubra]
MPRTKHAAMVGNERAGSSRSSADQTGEPDYFFRNPECAEKFTMTFQREKSCWEGNSRERDTLTKCEHFDATVLTRMGYRRTSRNTWVPKRQDSDEDEVIVAEAEDEPEGEEIDAEAMEFDVDADFC